MNKIIEQIEKIREINQQHKLVIFVGAGVSQNSEICTWFDLVKKIAIEVNYKDICEKCELKYLTYTEGEESINSCIFNNRPCQYEFNFSNDEYLKLPQYYYEEKGIDKYIQLLSDTFCNRKFTPNAIDELIIKLFPEHIITTNYDHLIEDVKHINVSEYKIIKADRDLLSEYGNHYIIKMHGDMDHFNKSNLNNIVLKEDDYLKYSHTHRIIEGYIKSLLFDKTFLFVGYALNDNNLKIIMSYIDFYAKNQEIKNRKPHYLVTTSIPHEERTKRYWQNKGVEMVNLSEITDFMKKQTPCDIKEKGKPLYTFLRYVQNDKLEYTENETKQKTEGKQQLEDKATVNGLKHFLYNKSISFAPFNHISYTTIKSLSDVFYYTELINHSLYFLDDSDYKIVFSILSSDDIESKAIKRCLTKAGIYSIYHKYPLQPGHYFSLYIPRSTSDVLFNYSMQWDFTKILERLSSFTNNLYRIYYYSLIYKENYNMRINIISDIESEMNKKDFTKLSLEEKYQISVLKFNQIALQSLSGKKDDDQWMSFNKLLKLASIQSSAFDYIKQIFDNNDAMINKLNKLLLNHEEYYMRKATIAKYGGTVYGDIFKLQAIVYDYYYFYKKNHLMLDWFNNVSKICEPYVKAIICTYYPDEYQYSNPDLGRTQVKPYPLNLIDINILIRHVKFKDFNSWLSYYKVFDLKLNEDLNITKIFDNFCTSVRSYWLTDYAEYINNFGRILSLISLSKRECHKILLSYLKLVTPDERISIVMLRTCLKSLRLFVEKHYDEKDIAYYQLLDLLINEDLINNPLDMRNDYKKLISMLSFKSDERIYKKCCKIIKECDSNRKKAYYPYVFKDIILKFNEAKWKKWIINNIDNNWTNEVFDYLENKIIPYNKRVSKYFEEKLKAEKSIPYTKTIPNKESELINLIVILHIIGIIPDLNGMSYLNQYCKEYPYLDFLLNPDSFDYSKINTADYMWCNLINSNKYRESILKHKSDFWSKENEKRIQLGFGDDFENRVVYKYLFD